MDVLKDASSIAIYGARGANGVIIINTKRGIVSAPRVTYSFSTAVQQDVKRVKMMSPYQFAKLQLELATRFSRTYLDPA
jgi:TonB-dependent SusC/RagA subfamily outer membrane receptor